MKFDNRIGASFKSRGPQINEVNFEANMYDDFDLPNHDRGQVLTWSRRDYGTGRLMLP